MSGGGRQVVITGIGLLTALGEGPEDTFKALVAGESGIGPIKAYDPAPLQTRLGAEMPEFDATRYATKRQLRTVNRGDSLALAAARIALDDAGLAHKQAGGDELGYRTGLYLGGNKSLGRMEQLIEELKVIRRPDGTADLEHLARHGDVIMPPLFFVEGLPAGAVFNISQAYGIRGSSTFFAGYADAGANAIGRAMRAVRRGDADVAIAGGYDDATSWWSMTLLDRLGILTTRNELGRQAYRPYDRERSGGLPGEGAALLVLEDKQAALARGARIYAELTGYGAGHDARTPPAADPQGRGLARAVRRSLEDARLNPGEVGYIAADGSGTVQGDASEALALRTALGDAAGRVPVSTPKPQTGHLVGGGGALNAAVAALALHHGVLPATLNLDHLDPVCAPLDHIRGSAREAAPTHAMALARGIEGQAVALTLSKPA
ncbi:beta-ketoacyl-[acyl-carrier-protein] synthase family protein [Streptacidiphilus pinicola]|uniref:Beta-ketoacyl-[acyl-carrier-protein] synthase family protein n=1 Tax=Streptacidiphilus pinicola TaxID=2219663 RepID=A0A2X0K7R7_9ACTN|nr:beta-ketoacyl-[acyl-carrier-protein] synthase family protein [Streptacidiphilus pinicola]RAG85315.1 beta-ketoacyl-[acyl-carrier-protein] synthase family protein [Streptacidiphilus pinicola]